MFDAEQVASFAVASPVVGRSVAALARSDNHSFGKTLCSELTLLQGLGVQGDAHCGRTDQHMHRDKPNPPPNLRQVHLFPMELIDELRARGFSAEPGALGENITTRGIPLVDLPLATRLRFPSGAVLELTGRRTPCRRVDALGKGLMKALMGDDGWGVSPIAGVMAIVLEGGTVGRGDEIAVEYPLGELRPLPGI